MINYGWLQIPYIVIEWYPMQSHSAALWEFGFSNRFSNYIYLFTYLFGVGHVYYSVYVWRSEDKLLPSVISNMLVIGIELRSLSLASAFTHWK